MYINKQRPALLDILRHVQFFACREDSWSFQMSFVVFLYFVELSIELPLDLHQMLQRCAVSQLLMSLLVMSCGKSRDVFLKRGCTDQFILISHYLTCYTIQTKILFSTELDNTDSTWSLETVFPFCLLSICFFCEHFTFCFSIVRRLDGEILRKYQHPDPAYGCDWSLVDK